MALKKMQNEDMAESDTENKKNEERPEDLAARYLMLILKYLELNNDMEPYLALYRILEAGVLDGIRISKQLREICVTEKMSLLPERGELLAGYGSYAYMKRKWKKLIRQEKRREKKKNVSVNCRMEEADGGDSSGHNLPEWEEVAAKVSSFAIPVWKSVCDGELFVGEWMPELGRFLD